MLNFLRRRPAQILGFVIFLFGWSLWMGPPVLEWACGAKLAETEYPLGEPITIAADKLGRIFVGDGFYGRIQRYSSAGQFEVGWFVKAGDGTFIIQPPSDNRLLVAAAREGLLTYSDNGVLLSQVEDKDAYTRVQWGWNIQRCCQQVGVSTYHRNSKWENRHREHMVQAPSGGTFPIVRLLCTRRCIACGWRMEASPKENTFHATEDFVVGSDGK